MILKMLKKAKIEVLSEHRVTKVSSKSVFVKPKAGKVQRLDSDLLLWTCGVKANPVVASSLGEDKFHGFVPVRRTLEHRKLANVFALGD